MDIVQVYHRVLFVANFYLKNASDLTLDEMKELDPNVESIARDMRALANLVQGLSSDSYDDQNMSMNAFQCCLVMRDIAECVECGNEQDLDNFVKKLEKHVKVP